LSGAGCKTSGGWFPVERCVRLNLTGTSLNELAVNPAVAQIARHYVRGTKILEPMLNRVEHGIRCYDPCLSCSTHAVGQMPLQIRLIGPGGTVLHEVARG